MTQEDRPGGDRPLTHGLLPVERVGGQGDLGDDEVDHAVEHVVLVGHVVVERHRFDPEPQSELAHGQCVDALLVGKRDGGAQHPLPVERRPRLGIRRCSYAHSALLDSAPLTVVAGASETT